MQGDLHTDSQMPITKDLTTGKNGIHEGRVSSAQIHQTRAVSIAAVTGASRGQWSAHRSQRGHSEESDLYTATIAEATLWTQPALPLPTTAQSASRSVSVLREERATPDAQDATMSVEGELPVSRCGARLSSGEEAVQRETPTVRREEDTEDVQTERSLRHRIGRSYIAYMKYWSLFTEHVMEGGGKKKKKRKRSRKNSEWEKEIRIDRIDRTIEFPLRSALTINGLAVENK